jgi:hypothetical protein
VTAPTTVPVPETPSPTAAAEKATANTKPSHP